MNFYKEQYANINTHKKKKTHKTILPYCHLAAEKKTEKRVDDINIFFLNMLLVGRKYCR